MKRRWTSILFVAPLLTRTAKTKSALGKNLNQSTTQATLPNAQSSAKTTDDGRPYLKNILLSHGKLDPPVVEKGVSQYVVNLDQPVSQVAIIPELHREGFELENITEKLVPKVYMTYEGASVDPEAECYAFALKKQIPLPSDGKDFAVDITIVPPADKKLVSRYHLVFKQNYPQPISLKEIAGVENTGKKVVLSPLLREGVHAVNVYSTPEAKYVDFKFRCSDGSTLRVNGKEAQNQSKIRIRRDFTRFTQVVEVSCAKSSPLRSGSVATMKYVLLMRSDVASEHLKPPPLTFPHLGHSCTFSDKEKWYECPQPGEKVQILSKNDPTVKYILRSKSGSEIRLVNGQLSIPITVTNDLELTAYSAKTSKSWKLKFGQQSTFTALRILGWFLAVPLCILLLSLFSIIGFTSIFGLGVPLGSTEIAATMTFIIQYLCFANYMRGSDQINQLVAPLKWVTMFWPLPWQQSNVPISSRGRKLSAVSPPPQGYGVALWGDLSLGDVTDIRNAFGCLFWSSLAFAVFTLVHGGVICKFRCFDSRFTFPHRMRFGNWESRTLHWLAFPAFAAAAATITTDMASIAWKLAAGSVMLFYVGWISFAFAEIYMSVKNEKVVWVWNTSAREDGELEDESGYWGDADNDQLVTQPVNRSLCRGFFPYRWISTVADIAAVRLSSGISRPPGNLFPPAHFQSNQPTDYASSKLPQVVEVIRTRSPKGFLPGQRLISGLLRTQWLDILFTYRSLINFHSLGACYTESQHMTVPLIVKTVQLTGPLTSGRQAFFFDGARIPFIRIADFVYRFVAGVQVGIALASEGHKADLPCFTALGIISACFLAYVAYHRPYTRMKENWMIVALLATVALSSFSFSITAATDLNRSWIAESFLWLVVFCCFLLAAYSCFVTFSLFSAFACPPLEESRFLEKLANCKVTVSDSGSGWSSEMSAYSKFPVRNMQARCTQTGRKRLHFTIFSSRHDASLEVSLQELKKACETGTLPVPTSILFIFDPDTELGYRHLQLGAVNTSSKVQMVDFFSSYHNALDESICMEIADRLLEQMSRKRDRNEILCITVVMDKSA